MPTPENPDSVEFHVLQDVRAIIGGTTVDLALVGLAIDPELSRTNPEAHLRATQALAALAQRGTGVVINLQPKRVAADSESPITVSETGELDEELVEYHDLPDEDEPVAVTSRQHFVLVGGALGLRAYNTLRRGADGHWQSIEFLRPYVARDTSNSFIGIRAQLFGQMIASEDDLRGNVAGAGPGTVAFLREFHGALHGSQAQQANDETSPPSFIISPEQEGVDE